MSVDIADGQLVHPKTPKLKDVDADRARAELERKISELQDIVRAIAARVP